MQDNGMESAVLVGAEKVVPAEESQGEGGRGPRVNQKEYEMLEITSSDTVVHPRTVVVHA